MLVSKRVVHNPLCQYRGIVPQRNSKRTLCAVVRFAHRIHQHQPVISCDGVNGSHQGLLQLRNIEQGVELSFQRVFRGCGRAKGLHLILDIGRSGRIADINTMYRHVRNLRMRLFLRQFPNFPFPLEKVGTDKRAVGIHHPTVREHKQHLLRGILKSGIVRHFGVMHPESARQFLHLGHDRLVEIFLRTLLHDKFLIELEFHVLLRSQKARCHGTIHER